MADSDRDPPTHVPDGLDGTRAGLRLSGDASSEIAALRRDMEAALAFAHIGLWRQDARTLHVWPDRRACEMLGMAYDPDGYAVAQTRAQAHPEDLPRVLAAYEKCRDTGEPSEALTRYPRPGGGWRHTLSRRIRRDGPDGMPETYLGVMIDISDIVERQREAAEAAHRIGLAQSALGLGIWSGQAGEEFAWWDEHMFRLRGVASPARQVSRTEALGYLHPDDRMRLAQAHLELDTQGKPWQFEFRVVWPDGTVRWLASRSQMMADPVTGAPHHFGVAWDVTDAHLAQQALRDGERARAESAAKSQFMSRMSHELRTPLNAILGFTQLLKRTDGHEPAQQALWLDHVEEAGRQLLVLINDMLELATADSEAPQPPDAPAHTAGAAAPARVLYIEDNPVNALLVEELLRTHPKLRTAVQLRVVATGTEGIDVAAHWQPALVLVDMQLPDMDGLELHRRLRKLPGFDRTPCVALSANAMSDDVDMARAAGFADYWTKPIQFDDFTCGLQRLLAQP
ncbi:MAG: PAS domain-containing protein [Burkholderiaceae bacterium]|nr:PAS domain-containing protein [Burkholderiaceae bacterium]